MAIYGHETYLWAVSTTLADAVQMTFWILNRDITKRKDFIHILPVMCLKMLTGTGSPVFAC